MLKEIELVDAFCAYLDTLGIHYKRELRRRSYHNEGYCDVVIRRGDKFTGIEAKINNFKALSYQVNANRLYYHYNFALYPRVPTLALLATLHDCGLIIPVDHAMKEFVMHRKVKLGQTCWCNHNGTTKRNWDENRAGRKMHASELPLGYDATYLKPTYEWTNGRNRLDDKLKAKYSKGEKVKTDGK